MVSTMFTIGYQGATLERLIQTLSAADVSLLVDTRETPMSRRPEFRPRTLEAALSDAGIGYVSVRALGAPKALRALAISDWNGFAEGYRERLSLVREELERLVPLIETERVCLLCFEADPDSGGRRRSPGHDTTLVGRSRASNRAGGNGGFKSSRPDKTDLIVERSFRGVEPSPEPPAPGDRTLKSVLCLYACDDRRGAGRAADDFAATRARLPSAASPERVEALSVASLEGRRCRACRAPVGALAAALDHVGDHA
jgi:hypothetical protein